LAGLVPTDRKSKPAGQEISDRLQADIGTYIRIVGDVQGVMPFDVEGK